jgi:uncharacterized membrane protein
MKQAFNSGFYATAATVIPVLYVALTLQGSTFEESLKRWRESVDLGVRTTRSSLTSKARVVGSLVITLLIGLLLIFGICAEFVTVLALYHRNAGHASETLVLIAISLLLVLVASVPVVRFGVTLYRLARFDYD